MTDQPYSTQILQIAIPSPLRSRFDYLPPLGNSGHSARIGQRIKVPFGPRTVVGIIIGLETRSDIAFEKLRHAYQILDESPALSPQIMALCQWTARYYHHPIGEVFNLALPAKLRQGNDIDEQKQWAWFTTEKGALIDETTLKRAKKQQETLGLLRQHPNGLSIATLKGLNVSLNTLKALEKKQLAEKKTVEHVHHETQGLLKEPELTLSEEQSSAVSQILKAAPASTTLLYGVTGSGKTEVYLQLIHQTLKEHKQALVLVPEIGLTPQTLSRFERRFNTPICLIHSGLNESERMQSWRLAQKGEAKIIIGTRSAIFTPMLAPGLIIVDEEHDLSYKQQDGLRYSARDLAVVRGNMDKIPVILGSATPALESMYNVQRQRYQLAELTQRANQATAPTFQLLDIRQQPLNHGLSEALVEQIKNHLDRHNQVLIFINRRGFAPVLLCQQCGWTAQCAQCETRYTLHKQPPHLHCHHCNSIKAIPRQCGSCGNTDLRPVGAGTERVEDGLKSLFPDTHLIRVDRDTTQKKHSFKEKLAAIQQGESLLLLGTQMLAKGHHFPNVTLVAIINADSGFLSTDFRGPERMSQLIIQVAGRAGRAEKPGHVILQSHQPDNPALQKLLRDGYQGLSEEILQERIDAELPPFTHAALFRAEALHNEHCHIFLDEVAEILRTNNLDQNQIEILGPVPAPMEKRAGRYRAQLLLQSKVRPPLHQLIQQNMPRIDELKTGRKVRWSLDVDPADFT